MAAKPKPEGIHWEDQKNYQENPGTNKILLIPAGEGWWILGEPIYRTVDGRLVHEHNPDGRWLYGGKGVRVPEFELKAGGLLQDEEDKGKHSAKRGKK
jgi:hypothetical protein